MPLPDKQSPLCRQRGITRSAAAVEARVADDQQATAASPSRAVARLRQRGGLLDPAGVCADCKGDAILANCQNQPHSTGKHAMAVVVATPASAGSQQANRRRWLVSSAELEGRRCDVSGCD